MITEHSTVTLHLEALCVRAKKPTTPADSPVRPDCSGDGVAPGSGALSEASDRTGDRPGTQESAQGPLDGISVLLVDDYASVLESVGSYLRHSGAHVETAQSGREALDCFIVAPPHVVVTDYSMPAMTGIELLKHIRELPGEAERPTPAILYTAVGHLRDVALAAGFSAYLMKPLNPRRLVDEIARLVAG